MPPAKIDCVRAGSPSTKVFSTPIASDRPACPDSTSFQAPWNAIDAVAQPPSTLTIGTRSGKRPSRTSGVKQTCPRMFGWPHLSIPQLPNHEDSTRPPSSRPASRSTAS